MSRRPGSQGARPAAPARGTLDDSVAEAVEPCKPNTLQCPWDCLNEWHEAVYRHDRTPIATHCLLCDRFVSNDEWTRTPTPRRP